VHGRPPIRNFGLTQREEGSSIERQESKSVDESQPCVEGPLPSHPDRWETVPVRHVSHVWTRRKFITDLLRCLKARRSARSPDLRIETGAQGLKPGSFWDGYGTSEQLAKKVVSAPGKSRRG